MILKFGLGIIATLVFALLMFGPKKLPEVAFALGKSMKEFSKGLSE
jgi:TatA/E family protein of Tat protein translocase